MMLMMPSPTRPGGLRVLGAGLGRTGTFSLKTALDYLGLGPTYHMSEVLAAPWRARAWEDAARGLQVDWESVFDGYSAAVDWPACAFWPELVAAFPGMKVILSVRDPDEWYASFAETVLVRLTAPPDDAAAPPEAAAMRAMVQRVIVERSFAGALAGRAHVVAAFERHNAAVQAAIPPDRLLVHRGGDGWNPLCEFLGVQVPRDPYPRLNDRAAFWDSFGRGVLPKA